MPLPPITCLDDLVSVLNNKYRINTDVKEFIHLMGTHDGCAGEADPNHHAYASSQKFHALADGKFQPKLAVEFLLYISEIPEIQHLLR